MKTIRLQINPRRRRKFTRVKARKGKGRGHLRRRKALKRRKGFTRHEWVIVAIVPSSLYPSIEHEWYWAGHSFVKSFRAAERFKTRKAAIAKMQSMRDSLPKDVRGLTVQRVKARALR